MVPVSAHYESTSTLCFLTLRNLGACIIWEDVANEEQWVAALGSGRITLTIQ